MLMIVLRLIHIVLGVFWAGAAFVTAGFLLPSAQAAGPASGPMMKQLIAVRRLPVVVMVAAILTLLSGLGMYWRDNSVSNGAFARSTQGMTLGLGAVVALLTLGLGMGVITPTGKKLTELMATIASSGGPPTAEQGKTMAALQARMMAGSRAAAALVLIIVITMAVARYL
jgi:uncharacterized membrane protein